MVAKIQVQSKAFQLKPSCFKQTDMTKPLISFHTGFPKVSNTFKHSCADYEVISGV
jgi:hypothetical protein